MNIVFMGTPDFAVPTLKKLCESGHNILAVYTQPDKPVGRKQVLTPPDVKVCALENGLEVFQPTSLKDDNSYEELKALNPDLIVVVAYGKILPKNILDIPRLGCVNVHGSLLPKYRGASPIQSAVLSGDKVSGVTTMFMGEGLDTGDILLRSETEIGENETSAELFDRLALLGADLLLETVEKLSRGEITPVKQDESQATYTKKITKDMCPINWSEPNEKIHNQVRGLQTWPVALTKLDGKDLKIHSTFLCGKQGEAGSVISLDPLTVACGEGSLVIDELQLSGKKRMKSDAFLLGHPLSIGARLG
ncbi:MAG: methionyl-tRNA formyltransferase [Ruminococcus sp.]|nr:methionyl-tRNA formyltransferase [Ruminococcus sp.]